MSPLFFVLSWLLRRPSKIENSVWAERVEALRHFLRQAQGERI
jgi:hypothetical protein